MEKYSKCLKVKLLIQKYKSYLTKEREPYSLRVERKETELLLWVSFRSSSGKRAREVCFPAFCKTVLVSFV